MAKSSCYLQLSARSLSDAGEFLIVSGGRGTVSSMSYVVDSIGA
jgi:hypothetical protein